ncbi:protocadherin-7 [Syngnathoides biaculeatus]|uniref:protocadherin-7 n=1 Tax=Syngnathoides biaculeatus TaxID=300417 RepID=UPI002ADDF7B1|nr:protocadherin-7 [Syngnathoides biaculeatus]XP_061685673.1 protocadherin-7 [Syngnathoides biaculeatus]XP_061685674.1 protocadherin-7 [Syngnathoides biaculeatus]XP_061685675.1 protocadherin-7 [Syngnathoides biaculeatus]
MRRLGAVHSSAQALSLAVLPLLQLLTQLPGARSALRYRVAEEGPPDVKIGNVAADLGLTAGTGSGDVTFALESGSEFFKIDNVTGELTTGPRRIDREKMPQCQMIFDENECFLDFEVSVIGPLQSWVDLFEGRVVITDINDNTPSFPSPVLQLSVEENRPIGTLYLLPTATDRDFGRNGIDRYELIQEGAAGASSARRAVGGTPIGRVDGLGDRRGRSGDTVGGARSTVFELQVADIPDGEKQPQLIVKGTLDREQKDSYELILRVRDGGNPPRSSQALLRVSITDVNDNSPQFERPTYEAEMAENAPPGTPVLQVRASDRDVGVNGQVEYVFGAATESVRRLLRLDEATGWLSVLHRIDREEVAQLRFTVTARDRGQPPRTDRTAVILAVRDENDNVPVVEIRKIGRIPVRDGAALVPENVLVDTPVALVQVSDRDQGENGAVTCTVVGDVPFTLKPAGETALPPLPADEAFDRNKKKFFLHTSALLDYEVTKEYSVTIVAVDSGSPSLSSNSSLMVRVVDYNDHPPVFAQSVVEVHFAENNSPNERVVTVVAADADSGKNAEIAYTLDAVANGPFHIDPDNGDIRAAGVLDREQRERYELKVIARDKGNPALQGSATVVIQVTDRNDNAPKFVQEVFTFYVKENLLANSPVGMVTVTDADEGENAELALYVEMDGPGEKTAVDNGEKEQEEVFSIENNTGTIFSTLSFDREKLSAYTFRVRAVDGGEPRKTATATVSLYVTDENDNAPSVTSPANESYTLLPPASSARTVVRTVTATDSDAGPNADLRYALVGGNPFRLFEIGHSNGVITLAEPLERRHRGLHRLVVRVNDSGTPSLCATALVHVFINESLVNASLVDAQVSRSLLAPLSLDIAGDPDSERALGKQRLSVAIGVLAGAAAVILVILLVVTARQCGAQGKNGYEAGKKEPEEDFFSPSGAQPQVGRGGGGGGGGSDRGRKARRDKRNGNGAGAAAGPGKSDRSLYSGIVTVNGLRRHANEEEEDEDVSSASERLAARYCAVDGDPGSPRMGGGRRHQSSPDLARHYKSSSPLPAVNLQPQSPPAEGKKHQAVQELPPSNTFVGSGGCVGSAGSSGSGSSSGNGDAMSLGSDQCSEYGCQTGNKYNKQGTLRRVTFSVVSQAQDAGCYDSGLEDSETPSSKSSSGPRLGVLPLPEEGYERTTPEGSVGEEEHVENDARQLPDVALTGKCTRECDEFGHSDTCWMPVRPSPRQRQRHGSDPPRLSTFAPGDDNNNLRRNEHASDSESAGSTGSSEPGAVTAGEGQRLPLVNGDALGTLGGANKNVGDHNRNLLNRKMTSASYDTFSSAGFGRRRQDEEGGEAGQNPAEVIPLTRTGADYKTASCLTLSRREVYL